MLRVAGDRPPLGSQRAWPLGSGRGGVGVGALRSPGAILNLLARRACRAFQQVQATVKRHGVADAGGARSAQNVLRRLVA